MSHLAIPINNMLCNMPHLAIPLTMLHATLGAINSNKVYTFKMARLLHTSYMCIRVRCTMYTVFMYNVLCTLCILIYTTYIGAI